MLIRVTPEQVATYWDFIKGGLEAALPPVVGMQSDRMSNILTSILTGVITIFMSVEKEKDNNITGFIATMITVDKPSGTRALLIYAVYGLLNSSKVSWDEGLKFIQDYARSEKCHRITAYSDVPSIIKYIESIGGEAKYRLLSIPL